MSDKPEELYNKFKQLVIHYRNECFNLCGQKKGKKVCKSEAEITWRHYQSVWFCSKCGDGKADYYKLD